MSKRVVEGVVSGPDPDGLWHWRPVTEDGPSQVLAPGLIDPGWTSGDTVRLRVRTTVSGLEISGPAEAESAEEAPLILLNGQPLELPPDTEVEPGAVVWAEVRYHQEDSVGPGGVAKFRPVVVVRIQEDFVVGRAVYSRNNQGRGQRLQEPETAGLKRNAVLDDGESLIPVDRVGPVIGWLASADRRRLRLR